MIQNPYAKKRPRPDHFTNENDSTGCDTNAGIAAARPIPQAASKRCQSKESQHQSVDPNGGGASLSSSSSSNGGIQYQTNPVNEQSKRNHRHPSHSVQPPHSIMETTTNGHVAQDQGFRPTLSQPLIRNPYATRTSSHATASHVIPNHAQSSSFSNHSVTIGGVLNSSQSTLAYTSNTGTATKVPTIHQPSCPPPTTNEAPPYSANPYKKSDSVPSQSNHVPIHTSTAIARNPAVQGQHSNLAIGHSSSVKVNHQRDPVQSATSFDETMAGTSNGQIMPAEPSSPRTCHPPILQCQRAFGSPLVETTLRSSVWQPLKSPSLDLLESCLVMKNVPDPPNAHPSDCAVTFTDPNQSISLTTQPPGPPLHHATYCKPSPSSLHPFQQPAPPRQNFEDHAGPAPTQAISTLRAATALDCPVLQSSITNKPQDPSFSNPYLKKSVSESNRHAPKNQGITTISTMAVLVQQAISSASSFSPSRPSPSESSSNQTSHVVPMIHASDTPTACQTRPLSEATQYPKQSDTAAPAHSMASIRPNSWAANSAPSTAKMAPLSLATQLQAATQTPKVELPGEDLLPSELQFSPEDLKPISDEYRQRLVANADISKPLLNGWTLFNHQKKVWKHCCCS
jgi:hypothetical protein